MTNAENAENAKHFICDLCNFKCSKNSNYIKHLSTDKHNRLMNPNKQNTKTYQCDCGKQYKHMSSLCKHKTNCNRITQQVNKDDTYYVERTPHMDSTIVIELLKQNQDFKDLMIEQAKQLADQAKQLADQQQEHNNQLMEQNKHILTQNEKITELAKNAGNVTNNNTTNNNKFNLNFFLNETCKDAITMNEFINSIEVTMEDFVRTGKIGFVDGISTVMVERIKGMDMHTRPMHCTDLKRETLYIKNDDAWEKGDTDKTLLRRAVKNIACKNYRQLKPWFDSSQPQVDQAGTDEYENYFQYYKAALGGCGKEEDRKFEDKIMKNVLKEVVVDK